MGAESDWNSSWTAHAPLKVGLGHVTKHQIEMNNSFSGELESISAISSLILRLNMSQGGNSRLMGRSHDDSQGRRGAVPLVQEIAGYERSSYRLIASCWKYSREGITIGNEKGR